MAWELGDGMGHVGRLLPVAARFAAEGYRPIFAVRDTFGALQRLGGVEYPVIQAPPITSVASGQGKFFARSFADILAVIGFGDIERLRWATRVWRSLVDLVRPELVIGDFAPMLALALNGRRVPLLAIGSGFAIPPVHLPAYPEVNADGTSIVREAELLDTANRFRREDGLSEVASLPALLGGDAQAVCTWSMLDPYSGYRHEPALGPVEASPEARPHRVDAPKWFAYVAADSPMAKPLLAALLASKTPGAAYVRKADDALAERFAASGHALHRKPPRLEDALSDATLMIHHGGINTAECALAMGVPQLVVSRHLEQHLTGDALRHAGAGRVVRGRFEATDLAGMIDRLAGDTSLARATSAAAKAIGNRQGALEHVVERGAALVARSAAPATTRARVAAGLRAHG